MRRAVLLSIAAAGLASLLSGQGQPSLRDAYYGYWGGNRPPQKAAPKQKKDAPKVGQNPVTEPPVTVTSADLRIEPLSSEQRLRGLKYKIKVKGNDVPADTNLRNGDEVQLEIQTNAAGYLYVVDEASDGHWEVMFPSATSGTSQVEAERTVLLPETTRQWIIESPPGVDKLFIVFALKPIQQIEKLFPGFQPKAKPGNDSPAIVAAARLDSSIVDRLRDARSRNLREAPVTVATPPDHSRQGQENAVYVVNVSRDDDSPLIADIQLRHR
jgi:hypothetical protein